MTDLIFETLLAEASFRVADLTIKGTSLDEAISEVTREMELNPPEVRELTMRSKKAPSFKPPVEEDEDALEEPEIQPTDTLNSIEFDSSEEMDQAVSILMYKSVPWVARSENKLSFSDSETIDKAHEVLKRRWDFINSQPRAVAQVTFDNLQDYNKVLDFMASKNMTVLKDSADDLDQDLDMEIEEALVAHKRASKEAKELGQIAPEEPSNDMAYKAMYRDSRLDPKTLDPFSDQSSRTLRVVKRWK